MSFKKMLGNLMLLLSPVVLVLALIMDYIWKDSTPGFGYSQMAGVAVAIVGIVVGFILIKPPSDSSKDA